MNRASFHNKANQDQVGSLPVRIKNVKTVHKNRAKSSSNVTSIKNPIYSNSERKARECIQAKRKTLIILRGAAGCGKSTLAKQLRGDTGMSCNTDDYFTNSTNVYLFTPAKLEEAHTWNQQNAIRAMENNVSPVIIDNTNCYAWEMAPYVRAGKNNHYDIHFIVPNNPWTFDPKICARLNKHEVSAEKIAKFVNSFKVLTIHDFDNASAIKKPQSKIAKIQSESDVPTQVVNEAELVENHENSENNRPSTPVFDNTDALDLWNSDEDNAWLLDSNVEQVEKLIDFRMDENSEQKIGTKKNLKTSKTDYNVALSSFKTKVGFLPAIRDLDMVTNNRWTLSPHLICGTSRNIVIPDEERQQSNTAPPSESVTVTLCNRFVQVSETSIALAYVDRDQDHESSADFCGEPAIETFTLQRNDRTLHCTKQTYDKSSQKECENAQSVKLDEKSQETQFEPEECKLEQDNLETECKVLDLLKNCFPDVPLEDLEHVLENCDGDAQWATNVLLDSGYEINWALENQSIKDQYKEYEKPDVVETFKVSEEKKPCCTMELSVDMATQLQQLFGTLEDDMPSEFLNPQKLKIELSGDLAAQLYHAWLNTQTDAETCDLKEQHADDVYQFKDEHLLNEEKSMFIHKQTKKDEQFARQLIDNETKILNNAIHTQAHALSTKIKMKMLTDMFSDVDKLALRELFKANNYNFEQTVTLVCESLNFPVERMRRLKLVSTTDNADSYPPLSSSPTSSSEKQLIVESEDMSSLTYENLRQRALTHCQKRQQYFEQAQQAFRKKMTSVASYYAQMGRIHDGKLKEANHLAAEKIVKFRKLHDPQDTVDLHGLHVSEAISALSDRLKEIEHRPGKQLNIVTGCGKHSATGPKIKPAVLTFLTRKMYKFYEVNSGLIQVTIS